MRNKAFLILIALCGLLMAATFGLWAYCSKLKSEQEKLDEVRRYIDDIQIELKRIHNCCYSVGNTIIDALLNRYVSQLSEQD
jgi:hypothetical protein